jgi:hypothetical protein
MKTELAVGYIKELIRVLNEKGVLYFQCPVRFTTEDGKDGETEFEFARSKATMEMNCHPREVIERAIEDGGGRIIKVDQDWSCGPVIESACYSVVRKTAKYTLGGVANCR